MKGQFEIFLAAPPGLESVIEAEARANGFAVRGPQPGGVALTGGWRDVIRANLELRCPTRVLARIGTFTAMALGQLETNAAKLDWPALLRPDIPVRVEATLARSKMSHRGAAADRLAKVIHERTGAPIGSDGVSIRLRVERDKATVSVDTSGEPLHRRGHKVAVGKAPLRETLAASFLRQCGYGGKEPVIDPMCGSGTFLIEAAEMACGLQPGRARSFDVERLALFEPQDLEAARRPPGLMPDVAIRGYDRDTGAVQMAMSNIERAGLSSICQVAHQAVSDLARPDGPPGLIMVNPPYGARIGEAKRLYGLYGALGRVLTERFSGWRVGLVTSDGSLARSTKLPFRPTDAPVPHGSLRITLYQTGPLP